MPFQPGESGNPAGRPPGARNKATRAIETMLDGKAEDIARKAIELAKDGDAAAIRLCLSRLCPPRRERPAPFDMQRMETTADAVQASAAIVSAVASGELTPGEGADLSKLVENFAKTLQIHDHEGRLRKLEANRANESGTIEIRVARLECDIPDADQLTDDEVTIELWDMARTIAGDGKAPARTRAKCKQRADEIEADIIAQAAQLARPDYARHLEWCRAMWRQRTGKDDFVPALTGARNGMGEYQDWEAPNVMRRRAALRARPDIQRLIAGAASGEAVQ